MGKPWEGEGKSIFNMEIEIISRDKTSRKTIDFRCYYLVGVIKVDFYKYSPDKGK